eukprot:1980463-Prymnesium_polylepis.2
MCIRDRHKTLPRWERTPFGYPSHATSAPEVARWRRHPLSRAAGAALAAGLGPYRMAGAPGAVGHRHRRRLDLTRLY